MSKITDLIQADIKRNPHIESDYQQQSIKLDVAVAVMKLRESQKLTQRQFAEKVGKPQPVIARIENGNSNVTLNTLEELAKKSGKKLKISFV